MLVQCTVYNNKTTDVDLDHYRQLFCFGRVENKTKQVHKNKWTEKYTDILENVNLKCTFQSQQTIGFLRVESTGNDLLGQRSQTTLRCEEETMTSLIECHSISVHNAR